MNVVLVHAVATVMMTGVIWFVQIVHYPLFARLAVESSGQYAREHARRTTWVVAPLMLTEAATAMILFFSPRAHVDVWMVRSGLILLAVIWLSTAMIQMPCHRKLADGLDQTVVHRLVATNWVRTVAWTGRAVIAVALMRSYQAP